jgi:hypothetical protein
MTELWELGAVEQAAATPTTQAIVALADAVASSDAPVVERLRASGEMVDPAMRRRAESIVELGRSARVAP